MKKIALTLVTIVILTSCWTNPTETKNTSDNSSVNTTENRNEEIASMQPEYKAELYGKVKQIEWNMFTISEIDTTKDPTINMEQAEKQAYMQSLPEAQRLDLKEKIQSSILWDVKVMIPVWIPMIKKELVWEDKKDLEATLADLKSWDIVSIWYDKDITDRKVSIFVKRSIRK